MEGSMSSFGLPVVFILWVAYAVMWVFSAATLTSIWHWVQGLPLVVEAIVWIVFLPWVVSLWIWHSSWPVWLRIAMIVGIAIATVGGSASGESHRRRRIGRRPGAA
jgi:hypothetical protein